MEPVTLILAALLAVATGALGLVLVRKGSPAPRPAGEAESLAARILANAEREADVLRRSVEVEVKDRQLSARAEIDQMEEARKTELRDAEKRLRDREERIDAKAAEQEARARALEDDASRTREREAALAEEARRLVAELERAAGLSAEQAREELLGRIESDARFEAGKRLQRIEEETRDKADDNARHVIAAAIQRLAGDFVVEAAISVVPLPSDDMKGRIIGREGRNIRALEAATGVNLIVDDTPEAILLSSFDPLRREVARLTLEKLMTDGRFHPTRIEETVEGVRGRLEKEMRDEAGRVIFELDVHDVHPDVVGLLGRLKYRLSYGQNNLAHAREVGLICGMMADELGLDRALAVRGGLLHDIGKALTHEVEGGHAVIGAEFARKCGEDPRVVNAIEAHHGDVRPTTNEAYLVAAGDALSAGRPGARRENMELYVKRLEDLEQVAGTFPGVEKVYALQAGREIRVLVDADTLSDAECSLVSRDIAEKIERELRYPGQIKVCLVRESRFIEYAR